MSIYANASNNYWKEREKKPAKSSLAITLALAAIVLLALAGSFHARRKSNVDTGAINQRRSLHEATLDQRKECESRVNSRQECVSICLPERNSIQRKTMHQACLHGCQQAHAASTALGCRGKMDDNKTKSRSKPADISEEDVFGVVGVLAYSHCQKFQSVDPKPDVFATCRKYHRAGTKQGFRLGLEEMNKILDEEWAALQVEP